ncbi:tigger transposable element-derived protein 6-like protein [Plakobranchus ocellatus]|uniref:Tigger transposable element-derived protein 6-like protein n=1 Tax=Plakobranchus ocellatus TaxID=259542 RepID=A0AAV4C065_9GAST|nr:tigger transposable element-derived protein 6-like protein [Plakobranchus ocellatus]
MLLARRIFSLEEEAVLVEYLLKASRIGFPLETSTLKSLAYDLAIRNSKRVPDSWRTQKSAGKDWLKGFKSRHSQLNIRTLEPTSIARATAFNKTNVGPFFDKLKQLYEELSLTPERIYNVDETALSTSQKPQKVVAESRVKQVAQLVSHERGETITMLGIINAIGNSLPPCLVFPRKQFKPHMIFGAPPGTHGFFNPSGWMTKQLFVECLRHIHRHVRSTPENKVLVILDNHESHISIEAVDYCRDNGIVLLSLPPHCSHKVQPLDRTIFGPLKMHYNKAINSRMYVQPSRKAPDHP